MTELKHIIEFRHKLHQFPEISNNEHKTAETVTEFIKQFSPEKIIEICRTGRLFIFEGKSSGSTLVFRAELDALPITEISELPYKSNYGGIAHLCGHDGHMAIIAGLAQKISENRPDFGTAVLLFQPAEEVEQGAEKVVESPEFKKLEPDYIFGLHNIPGVPKHQILLRKGIFAVSSKGMTIKLSGKTSHAGEPENGISPAIAIEKIIRKLTELSANKQQFNDFTILTIIYIRLGEIAFGTSPGDAEVMITLRSFENRDMELLTKRTEEIIYKIAQEESLKCKISQSEFFPATVNNDECVELIELASKNNNCDIKYLEQPFKWSEDFSYYSKKYKTGFFGLGAGLNQPQLHNPDYDFPDEIIETGINIFYNIYKQKSLK